MRTSTCKFVLSMFFGKSSDFLKIEEKDEKHRQKSSFLQKNLNFDDCDTGSLMLRNGYN